MQDFGAWPLTSFFTAFLSKMTYNCDRIQCKRLNVDGHTQGANRSQTRIHPTPRPVQQPPDDHGPIISHQLSHSQTQGSQRHRCGFILKLCLCSVVCEIQLSVWLIYNIAPRLFTLQPHSSWNKRICSHSAGRPPVIAHESRCRRIFSKCETLWDTEREDEDVRTRWAQWRF